MGRTTKAALSVDLSFAAAPTAGGPEAVEFDPGIAFRTTLAMVDAGIEIMRGQLKRKHPTASREELQVLLNAWLADRRGAPFGDGPGTPRPIRPATT